MASDNHAHYGRVGVAVALGVAAIVATLIYLGGFGDRSNEFLVETYYDNPVSGLSVGSPVNFRGVKVGEVREIAFAGVVYDGHLSSNDQQRVSIVLALDERKLEPNDDWPMPRMINEYAERGLRATVTSSGITGLSRIELNLRPDLPAPEKPRWIPRYPLIHPAPSFLESFSDSATRLMNQIHQMDLVTTWSNFIRAVQNAARLADNANEIVEGERERVSSVLRNLERATDSLGDLAERVRDNPSLLLRENDPEPLPETR